VTGVQTCALPIWARGSTVKARRNASMRELALVGRVRGGRGRVLSCPLSRVARAARPAFHESASDGGSGGVLGPDAGLGLRGRAGQGGDLPVGARTAERPRRLHG